MPDLPKQHYIPAALIGGFGEPSGSGKVRDAVIAVLDKKSGNVFTQKAENVGWQSGIYSLHILPDGEKDVIDSLWKSYEPLLPKAVAALADRRESEEDLWALRLHASCAAVRAPHFPSLLKDWYQKQGSEITDTQAKAMRLEWIDRDREMGDWFWRALHAPSDVNVLFMLPDTGFSKFCDGQPPHRTLVFLPLSPRVGLLGTRIHADSKPGFENLNHRDMTLTGMCFLNNLGTLNSEARQLFTHPTRIDRLKDIFNKPPSSGEYSIPGGPYRRTTEWWFGH